tara:strand:+ start:818 stop:2269 length:1452 start_codon:yes stop_codon:yes gene_type:complete
MTENLIIKHRHFLTSAGAIRLRYVLPSVAVCVGMLWTGMVSYSKPSNALVHDIHTNDVAAVMVPEPNVSLVKTTALNPGLYDPEQAGNGVDPYLSRIGQRPAFDRAYVWNKIITVAPGDTLGTLMEQTGLEGDDYASAMKSIKEFVDPQSIRPGHTIKLSYIRLGEVSTLEEISYIQDSLTNIVLSQDETNAWTAEKKERPVTLKTHAAKTQINNSLFADLGKAGVPDGIINDMIQAFSWSVDFQRDIWGGETVELLYDTKETEDGSYVRSGKLQFVKLTLRDREIPIYFFQKKDGSEGYFEPNGQSIRRALMRTPVDGARISSKFGKRTHPVLGYTKMHKGMDFAAPSGTPIYAAGDGVIERANRFSSFGNYVKIRHNGTYETAYAHMKGFAKGIRAGKHVKQGDLIGYIGTTGRSTGPHLHYEVHKNGVQVNPQSLKLPIGQKLAGTDLANFKQKIGRLNDQYASLSKDQPKLANAAKFNE